MRFAKDIRAGLLCDAFCRAVKLSSAEGAKHAAGAIETQRCVVQSI